jgi:polyisoprenoid-binding protein YceI
MSIRQTATIVLTALLMLLLAACGASEAAPAPVEEATPQTVAEPDVSDTAQTFTIGAEADVTETFVIVPEESQAAYVVDEEFLADALGKLGIAAGSVVVVGTTPGVSGELQLNFGRPELVQAGTFTVDLTRLATDQERRDSWLRNNALQTARFPQAQFTATGASGLPATYTEGQEVNFQLTGDLTIRDMTNRVTFDVTAVLSGDTLRGKAILPLQMTDFGIDPPNFVNTLTVANSLRIEVDITAKKS